MAHEDSQGPRGVRCGDARGRVRARRLRRRQGHSGGRSAGCGGDRRTERHRDGAALSGFFFAPKDSEYHLQLIAVGRVGETVTVVVLGQAGKADEAPKDAFKATVATAMQKLGANG